MPAWNLDLISGGIGLPGVSQESQGRHPCKVAATWKTDLFNGGVETEGMPGRAEARTTNGSSWNSGVVCGWVDEHVDETHLLAHQQPRRGVRLRRSIFVVGFFGGGFRKGGAEPVAGCFFLFFLTARMAGLGKQTWSTVGLRPRGCPGALKRARRTVHPGIQI